VETTLGLSLAAHDIFANGGANEIHGLVVIGVDED